MNKKIISKLLQLPLILLVITSFFASIYASVKQIGGVTIATPIIIGIILALYLYGRYLDKKRDISKSFQFSIFLFAFLTILLLNFTSAFSGSGTGTLADPFIITNCTQLQEMNLNLSSNYTLGNNINCSDTINWNSGSGFLPIGNSSPTFKGNFNGQNYIISSLFINRAATNYIGLFGYVDTVASVRNIGLESINITGSQYVGGLIGYSKGQISNSFTTGNVKGSSSCGGLSGYAYAAIVINDSYSNANVRATDGSVGGLIGYASAPSGYITLNNTYATGNITGDGFIGGLVGSSYNLKIYNSYATGNVTSTDLPTGGLIGYPNGGEIINCYATGNIYSTASRTGGLLGSFSGTITINNSYATGIVASSSGTTGGFSGDSEGTATISNCYATGNVTGASNIGGFIGELDYSSTISKSYSTGKVTGSSGTGGFVGYLSSGSCSNSFWNNQTSGLTTSACLSSSSGKITAHMKNVSTYTNVAIANAWDFIGNPYNDTANNNFWDINSELNNGYPVLSTTGIGTGAAIGPSITFVYPTNNAIYLDVEEINFTAYDSNGISSCWFSNSSGEWNSTSQAYGLNFTSLISNNGWNNWIVYCNDTLGTVGNTLVTFNKDYLSPNFTAIENKTAEYLYPFSYQINATDDGAVSCFTVNDTTNFNINCSGHLKNNSVLNNGLYWINITVNDTFNRLTSALISINVTDTAGPTFIGLSNQTIGQDDPLEYQLNATDSSGVSCFTVNDTTNFNINCSGYLTNNTELTEYTYWINLTVNDTYNNQNSAVIKIARSSVAIIGLTLISPTGNINVNQSELFNITLNASCSHADCGQINVTLDPSSVPTTVELFAGSTSSIWGSGSSANADPTNTYYHDARVQSIYLASDLRAAGITAGAVISKLYINISQVPGMTLGSFRIRMNHTVLNTTSSPVSSWNATVYGPTSLSTSVFTANRLFEFNFTTNFTWDGTRNIIIDFSRDNSAYVSNGGLYVISGLSNGRSLGAYQDAGQSWPYDAIMSTQYTLVPKIWLTYTGGTSGKGGAISTAIGTTPFYTTTTNPYNLTLNNRQSALITWQVNATGTVNTPYLFFAYANMTSNMTITSSTSSWNVTIRDITPPILNITYPINNANYTFNISAINYTYSDYNGAGTCWYSNSSGIWNSTSQSSSSNFINVKTIDGLNNFTVYCNDSSGNLNNYSVSFFKDSVYPIFSNYWSNNATMNGTGIAIFNITILNTNGTVFLEINGTNYTANNVSADVWNYSLSLTNGTYPYKWHSWGNYTLTNYNSSTSRNYILYGNLRVINFSTMNSSSAINVSIPQGRNVTIITYVENAANILTKVWQTFIGGVVLWQGFMANLGGTLWSVNVSTNSSWPIGQINYTLYVNDSLNYQISMNGTFNVIDTTLPVVYLKAPLNGSYISNATQWFASNFTDNVGIQNVSLYVWNSTNSIINLTTSQLTGIANTTNISITFPYNGIFRWNYYACDNSSNCAFNSTNWTITYDDTPPALNIVYPSNTSYNINVRWLNYTYSDTNALGSSCWYSNSSGLWNSSSQTAGTNFTSLTSIEGSNTWTVYCNDSANNINSSTVTFVKHTPHIGLNIISPTGDINITQNQIFQVSVNVSCSNTDCEEINVTLDPASIVNITFNATQSIQTWVVPSGVNSIDIEAYGSQGGKDYNLNVGGFGARMRGTFSVSPGEIIQVVVGSQGSTYGSSSTGGGGGGGSFVWRNSSTTYPLIAAGGGGGGWSTGNGNATNSINGTTPSGGGAGGTNGNGGSHSPSYGGGGGAGWLSNGTSNTDGYGSTGGKSKFNFTGGTRGYSQYGATGGYGGGGGTTHGGGGGGGYSGGGGASNSQTRGGGGGSYNNGTNQNNSISTLSGNGTIIIYYTSGKSGAVSMNSSATPFYTTTTNPYNLTLNENQSQIITWTVNATGTTNTSYTFFIYANKTSDLSIGNTTNQWNVTITGDTGLIPAVAITYPQNTNYSINVSALNYTVTGNNLSSCWYSANFGQTNSTAQDQGINWTGITSNEGSNTWIVYCNNTNNTIGSSSVTFYKDTTSPNATLLAPQNNTYSTNASYNFTANLSDNLGIRNATLNIYNITNSLINQTTVTYPSGVIQTTVGIVVTLVNGIYNWFYSITDTLGNTSTTSNYTLTVDSTPPRINITYPTNNTNYTTNLSTINYTITENIALSSCWYSANFGQTNSTAQDAGTNFTSLTSNEGWNNWTVYCNDTTNNINSSTVRFYKDSVAPNVTLNSPAENYTNNLLNSASILFNCSASDSLALKNISLFITNSTNGNFVLNRTTSITGISNSTNWTLTLGVGNYTWNCLAFDSLGNSNFSTNRTLSIYLLDITNPLISFISPTPADETIQFSSNFEINISVTEQNLNSLNYNWNGTNFTIYDNSLALIMNFNNRSVIGENSTYTVDASKYGNNGTAINGAFYNASGKYNGAYQFDGTDDYIDLGIPDSTKINETITLSAWVKTSATTGAYRDIIANQWQFQNSGIMLTMWGASTIHVPWSNGSIYDYYDATYTVADGSWHFLAATFSSGDIRIYADGNLIGNKTSTTVTKIGYNDANHLLIGKDSGTGGTEYWNGLIDEVIIWNRSLSSAEIYHQYISNLQKFNSTQWYIYINQSKNTTTGLDIGTYDYQAFVTDISGNSNSTEKRTIIISDSAPPRINTTYPTNNANYTTNISALNYTASDNIALSSCWWSNSSGIWNSTPQAAGTNFTSLTSNEGWNNWTVYCNDTSNNINSSTVRFYKDSIAPNITLNAPVASYTSTIVNSANITFNCSASDNLALKNISLFITNSTNGNFVLNRTTSITGISNSTNWTLTLGVGNYTWNCLAFDSLGNSNWSVNRTIFIQSNTAPNVTLNSPTNNTILNKINSVILNTTISDANGNSDNLTVWFYGGYSNGTYSLLNTSYNQTNGTTITFNWTLGSSGRYNWTVIANDGLSNSTNYYFYFNLTNFSISCEAGGPYQQGALVLVQGTIKNESTVVPSYPVNISIYNSLNVLNASQNLTTANDGGFETTFANLSVGLYTLNATATYRNYNETCQDIIQIGSPASLILDKLLNLHNMTNTTITYNITLIATNKGGSDALSSLLIDSDSTSSPYILGTIAANSSTIITYLKTYTRNSSAYNTSLAIAVINATNSYSQTQISSNSTQIVLAIPSSETAQQLTLTKNVYYISENSTSVNYTLTIEIVNSGGIDLSGISLIDSDLDLTTTLSLNRTQSYNHSNSVIISKAATNTDKLFVKSTATVNLETYSSNQINVRIPGYGGPADAIVNAPASVSASTSFSTTITLENQNPDIGQDFTIDYWITNDDESINYASGQQTIYVPSSGSTDLTATLTSPSSAGNYRLRALVSWAGGTATSYDSFTISSTETPTTSPSTSTGGGGVTGRVIEKIVCNQPYIRYGTECCLDNNNNSICDNDEKEEISCNQPYIRHEKGCCLDTDSDAICDNDEPQKETDNKQPLLSPIEKIDLLDSTKELFSKISETAKSSALYFEKSLRTDIILILLLIIIAYILYKKRAKKTKFAKIWLQAKKQENYKPHTTAFENKKYHPDYIKKTKIKFSKIAKTIINEISFIIHQSKFSRKKNHNYLNSLKGKHVYSSDGNKIGIVKEVMLAENKIHSLVVKLGKKYKSKKKILIKHRHINVIKDIIIVENKIEDFLNSL